MLSVQMKMNETFLQVYFVLQPEGGVLLQHRGNRDGVGRVNATGQPLNDSVKYNIKHHAIYSYKMLKCHKIS